MTDRPRRLIQRLGDTPSDTPVQRRRAHGPYAFRENLEFLGMTVLVLVVVCLWLLLVLYLSLGWGLDPYGIEYIDARWSRPSGHYGIELALLPLAAVLGAFRGRHEGRHEGRPRWLPVLVAGVLFAGACYLGWTWQLDPGLWPVRLLGAALVAGVGYCGSIFYPRLTAFMAGGIAGPAIFGLWALTFSWEFLDTIADGRGRELYWGLLLPWGLSDPFDSFTTGSAALIVLAGGAVGSLMLVGVWWWQRPRVLAHAARSAAVTLYLAASGIVFGLVHWD